MMRAVWPIGLVAALLAGCALTPSYVQPASQVPSAWPSGAAYAPQEAGPAGLPWRSLITSDKLRQIEERALANNRDLRVALANVAAARAQFRAQASQQLPTVTAGASGSQQSFAHGAPEVDSFSASVGFAAFDLDLFGRQRSLSKQAFEQYLATASGMRASRLIIVAETADAYLTLAADQDLLAVARDTAASAERTVALTQSLLAAGLGAAGDVDSARTVLTQAQSDVERDTTLVAQDRNALEFLVGAPVEDDLLPATLTDLESVIGRAPAGLNSAVLRDRPDVLEAEHQLKAAYAGVGAARAAFYPSVSLTTSGGLASMALSALLAPNAWNVARAATASMPVLGGDTRANLRSARAKQAVAVATYDKAVQGAFRDVADALARAGTMQRQRAAQRELVKAAEHSLRLSDAQYRAGVQPYLATLIAQRTYYAARQGEISTMLDDLHNRIALYEAIGADNSL